MVSQCHCSWVVETVRHSFLDYLLVNRSGNSFFFYNFNFFFSLCFACSLAMMRPFFLTCLSPHSMLHYIQIWRAQNDFKFNFFAFHTDVIAFQVDSEIRLARYTFSFKPSQLRGVFYT